MRTLKIYQVDSFTTEKFKGNPAGVVLNADGLTDQEMLCIAREMNNSETAFIFKPDGADHEIRIRYFTPITEVPVCGHATVAAHYVRAVEQKLNSSTVIHKIGIGTLPVEIIREDNDYSIMMTQGKIEFYPPFARQERDNIVDALGLNVEELDPQCPIQIVSTGHSKVMIGIKTRRRLNALSPDFLALTQISKMINCNGYFVFTMDSEQKDILTHGRMFAPAIGINEDPVTGNANGPLGAYLINHGLVKHNKSSFSFTGEQGFAIGRSGLINVTVHLNSGKPEQVKIGGRAVIVFKTEIQI
ncbi:phenazine biosynthesis protein PhzF family [Desulfosporosinus orientis DSM 765]|uniref:Phenazine biosynthesis protein PhzF family n=1 Tax=Desulfosporosinus orientis (strain ATCC 19365 / DSM 765 / NCIMB 8382 / VKM B-1628 / Singapore I) TaxID=768706 RepID=G7WBF7_DESOD|nr:PhzF family isomerase [Desulfosporosinus orientis]AET68286.1 phenazine biosynthesis protein PhzF family [Desulfosporosinus orientis DSM 765]